jgi:hypothetical protein
MRRRLSSVFKIAPHFVDNQLYVRSTIRLRQAVFWGETYRISAEFMREFPHGDFPPEAYETGTTATGSENSDVPSAPVAVAVIAFA